MPAVNWGMLEKSQVDPETIEEAIARLIAEHNEDEEAHLDAGQSLQSHKASEIIDHVVDSIIADKIHPGSVTPEKLSLVYFGAFFDSLDGYYVSAGAALDTNLGCVRLTTAAVTDDYQYIFKFLEYRPSVFSWDKERRFETTFLLNSVDNVRVRLQTGRQEQYRHIGFYIENDSLKGSVGDGNNETTVVLQTISASTKYAVLAVLTPGVKCEFYVNGTKKAEITSGLPSGATSTEYLSVFQLITKNDVSKALDLSYFDLRQGL